MKYLFAFLLLFSQSSWALDAVITVLEAPLFREKNLNSPVVQYYRKGDIIKIHPSLANDRKYDEFAPTPEKYQALKSKMQRSPEYKEDPLFKGESENTFYIEDEFIPTLDRQGKRAYILSEHIYVYFNDSREFSQTPFRKDPTDYRLYEPLSENYPLKSVKGYRGQFLMGLSQPNTKTYPYTQSVKSKGHDTPITFKGSILKRVSYDEEDRFYFGGTMSISSNVNKLILSDDRQVDEWTLKFGLGPQISYDAYKGEKNRLNLSMSILVYIYNELEIDQASEEVEDGRLYKSLYHFSPQISIQYHRKQIVDSFDFVLGTSMEMETPTTYRANNSGSQQSWWQDVGDDSFTTSTTFALSGYIGIQSAY